MAMISAARRDFACRLLRSRSGQLVSEYLLMLGVIAAFIMVSIPLFYRKLLGAFFMVIGKVLGG